MEDRLRMLEEAYDFYFNDDYGYWYGWDRLLTKKARFEHLNDKFSNLMYSNQKDETIEELKKYFDKVTREMMIADGCDEYCIEQYKNMEVYKLN